MNAPASIGSYSIGQTDPNWKGPQMLFRRFGIVTLSIMLMGMLLAQAVETHNRTGGDVSLESRMKQWERFDKKRACEKNIELCFTTVASLKSA
jgi:hypothetical protein